MPADVFAFAVTIPLLIALLWFVGRTQYGKAMRATAQDPDAARLMGINVDRTIGLTFLLGGVLAGAAGMIYAHYNGTVQFNQGFTAGLIAFTAAVMGGIGNLKGAVVGGLIIGVIQSISDTTRPGLDARDRVRDPDPGHGLQALRPVRRGGARGMSTAPRRSARTAARPADAAELGLGRASRSLLAIALPVHHRPADLEPRRPARRVDPDARLHRSWRSG